MAPKTTHFRTMSRTGFFGRKHASAWLVDELRRAIEHFVGIRPRHRATKEELVEALSLIAEEQSLTANDGFDTWWAVGRGQALPPKRPVTVSHRTPRIHQIVTRLRSYHHFLRRYLAVQDTPSTMRDDEPTVPTTLYTPAFNRIPNQTQNAVPTNPIEGPQAEALIPMINLDEEERAADNTELDPSDESEVFPSAPSAIEIYVSQAAECSVCFEHLGPANKPRRNITGTCNHEPDVCNNCLRESIASQFANKIWDQIDCPTCNARLAYKDIKLFADSSVFGR